MLWALCRVIGVRLETNLGHRILEPQSWCTGKEQQTLQGTKALGLFVLVTYGHVR